MLIALNVVNASEMPTSLRNRYSVFLRFFAILEDTRRCN